MSEDMVERVARVIAIDLCDAWHRADSFSLDEVNGDTLDRARATARAAIGEMREPSDAFLALVAERMHDARFSRSGETYPVPRNFLRAVVDAALSEAAREELSKQAQELDMGHDAPSG